VKPANSTEAFWLKRPIRSISPGKHHRQFIAFIKCGAKDSAVDS
jgi:hypothetical protein